MFGLKKKEKIRRYWDFQYVNKFLKVPGNRDNIELFELRMYGDRDVGEVFIKDGLTVRTFNKFYQQFYAPVDGVVFTSIDIPAMHVIYKGGAEEWMACYVEQNVSHMESHRKLEIK